LTAIEDEKSPIRRAVRRYGMWKRVRLIERLQPEGKLLDVGCATGLFLAEMQRTGRWDVMGIEPSGVAASYAKERFGLQIFHGPLEEFHVENKKFDVITLWNVLEHLHTPIQALRRITKFLRPNGWAIITIPNLESFEARVFKDTWLGWELPRHLYWFPQQNLGQILQAVGLTIRDKRCFISGHNTFGLSLRFWLGERLRSSPKIGETLLRIYNSLPARVALSPLWWTIGQARGLTLLTVIAKKTETP
jgi:SAM-dependent methyltransferase